MPNDEEQQIQRLAQEGDVYAQIYLGWAYDRYGPYSHNRHWAESWLRRAAATGNIEGLRRLARALCDQQDEEAVEIANALARRGDFYGHYLLGHLHFFGDCNARPDREAALMHLRKAGDMGHLISQADLVRRSNWFWVNPIAIGKLALLTLKIAKLMLRDPDNLAVYR